MIYQEKVQSEWREEEVLPFDELMFSWNAERPSAGQFLFYVSVKTEDWSPWLLYASWGSGGQSGYHTVIPNAAAKVYQDTVEILDMHKATGFQIKIAPEGNASLSQVHGLYVYTNSDRLAEPEPMKQTPAFVRLPIKGLSQKALQHPRYKDLCSPTSTTAVVRYLSKKEIIDPIQFAIQSWDGGFNIFGNWVLNVAQAAVELGPEWRCWVERLSGFGPIYQRLQNKTPVVVSVRSPLPGSPEEYFQGHLITVIGYDPEKQKVICLDPASSSDAETVVPYNLDDFIQAWGRRGRIAYLFEKRS